MRLEPYNSDPKKYTKLPKSWWRNFCMDALGFCDYWENDIDMPRILLQLRQRLKEEHNAFLIETHFGLIVDFDHEEDATLFLLRWS